MSEIFIAAGEL